MINAKIIDGIPCLEAVLACVSSGVVIMDQQRNVVHINDTVVRILELENENDLLLETGYFESTFRLFSYPDHRELPIEEWPLGLLYAGKPVKKMVVYLKRQDRDVERLIEYSGTTIPNAQGEPELQLMVLRDITEEEQARQELKTAKEEAVQQKNELQAILDNVSNGISVFDPTGKHVYRNDANARIYGFKNAEAAKQAEINLGRDYLQKVFSIETYPEGKALAQDDWAVNQVLAGKEAKRRLYTIRRDDIGMEKIISIAGSPVRNSAGEVILAVLATQDITKAITDKLDLKEAKEIAEEKHALLDAMVNNLDDVVLVMDMSGNLIFANKTEDMLLESDNTEHVTDLDRLSQTFELETLEGEVLPPEAWPLSRVMNGERIQDLKVLTRRKIDGREWYFSVSGSPLFAPDGHQTLALLVRRDISEDIKRSRKEQELQKQMEQSQRLESLGVLAGGIAHDFNNILMAIMGYSDLILMELPNLSPARADVKSIKKSSKRAADLCAQLLAYSGKGKLEDTSFSMTDLVQEMLHMLKTCISKKCVLNANLAQALPATQGDPSQVQQILMNFVLNASDAIGESSGVINVSTGVMECTEDYLADGHVLRPETPGLYVWLEVSDNGIGMDHNTMEHMFEPFFTTKFSGRGLGLSAVLGILRSHHGGLRVYSEPGEGTTFKAIFPVKDEHGEILAVDVSEAEELHDWKGTRTILLVDDEESIRAVSSRHLQVLGIKTVIANDGQEAVEIYTQKRQEIDLVLMDLTMPVMNGAEAFRELRQINPAVKVVLASGYSEIDAATRFAGKKSAGYLRKPYTLQSLNETLLPLLGED